ncbi:MAG: hypothetical protein ABR898_17680, partial [Terracidiphilus sp.]
LVNGAAPRRSSRDAMESFSMTSIFITAPGREVKALTVEKRETEAGEAAAKIRPILPVIKPNGQMEKW